MLDALRNFDDDVPPYLNVSTNLVTLRGWPAVVTLRPTLNDADRHCTAQAWAERVSAVEATLSFLHRLRSHIDGIDASERSVDLNPFVSTRPFRFASFAIERRTRRSARRARRGCPVLQFDHRA